MAQIHKLLFDGRSWRMKRLEIGVKFSISILLTTLLISSNYYKGCECQLLMQQNDQLSHHQQQLSDTIKALSTSLTSSSPSSSSIKNGGDKQKQAYLVPASSTNFQKSFNYNPNYYYNQDNVDASSSQYAQSFIDHHYNSMFNDNNYNLSDYHHPARVQQHQQQQHQQQQEEGWSPISLFNQENHRTNHVNPPQTHHGHSPNYPFTDRPQQQTPRPRTLQHNHSKTQLMMVPQNGYRNDLDQQRRAQRSDPLIHGLGLDFGRSIGDTVIQSAIFPVTFFAFAMIFMDIMGRLIPVRLPSIRSVLGMTSTTTTTPPPPTPKVTKIEFNPPPFPNIGDILAEQVAGLKRLKAVKKNGKDGHHTDSSEEYYHDSYGGYTRRRRLPSKRSKKKRKKNKNKSNGVMTWSKLQKLYKTYKPTVL